MSDLKRFDTGAVRGTDCDDVRHDLVPRAGLRRLAGVFARGAKKYGVGNWEKGIPLSDLLNHALTHLYSHLDGVEGEDHLAHAAANLFMAMHFSPDPTVTAQEPIVALKPMTDEEQEAFRKALDEGMKDAADGRYLPSGWNPGVPIK